MVSYWQRWDTGPELGEEKRPRSRLSTNELGRGWRRLPGRRDACPMLFSRKADFPYKLLETRIVAQAVPVFVEQQTIQRVVKTFRVPFTGLERFVQPAKNIICIAQVNMDYRFPIKFRVRFRLGSPQLLLPISFLSVLLESVAELIEGFFCFGFIGAGD